MYAAIDALADKLDRQVLKYKEKQSAHRTDRGGHRTDAGDAAAARATRRMTGV